MSYMLASVPFKRFSKSKFGESLTFLRNSYLNRDSFPKNEDGPQCVGSLRTIRESRSCFTGTAISSFFCRCIRFSLQRIFHLNDSVTFRNSVCASSTDKDIIEIWALPFCDLSYSFIISCVSSGRFEVFLQTCFNGENQFQWNVDSHCYPFHTTHTRPRQHCLYKEEHWLWYYFLSFFLRELSRCGTTTFKPPGSFLIFSYMVRFLNHKIFLCIPSIFDSNPGLSRSTQ